MELVITVTYDYTIKIDPENPIAKEYNGNKGEMMSDLADYRFTDVLPLMKAVTIRNIELIEATYKDKEQENV